MRSFSLKDFKSTYERFNEERKIAFIVAGGAAQLFQNRQEGLAPRYAENRT